jgi:hypothetical protein
MPGIFTAGLQGDDSHVYLKSEFALVTVADNLTAVYEKQMTRKLLDFLDQRHVEPRVFPVPFGS